MVMFGPKMGTWMVKSESDPRWNKTGRGYGLISSGGPKEMQDWIKYCKENYGEPPKDAYSWFIYDCW